MEALPDLLKKALQEDGYDPGLVRQAFRKAEDRLSYVAEILGPAADAEDVDSANMAMAELWELAETPALKHKRVLAGMETHDMCLSTALKKARAKGGEAEKERPVVPTMPRPRRAAGRRRPRRRKRRAKGPRPGQSKRRRRRSAGRKSSRWYCETQASLSRPRPPFPPTPQPPSDGLLGEGVDPPCASTCAGGGSSGTGCATDQVRGVAG